MAGDEDGDRERGKCERAELDRPERQRERLDRPREKGDCRDQEDGYLRA
jgi:hypothetical protein